jgi:hypothetical protein
VNSVRDIIVLPYVDTVDEQGVDAHRDRRDDRRQLERLARRRRLRWRRQRHAHIAQGQTGQVQFAAEQLPAARRDLEQRSTVVADRRIVVAHVAQLHAAEQ